MSTISQKIHNYNYAPGIVTYGATGKTGAAGLNGCNMFFTNTSLVDTTEFKILVSQIINNYLPVKNSDTLLERTYQNGDVFFNIEGLIYQLFDIDQLKKDNSSQQIKTYSTYFKLVGRITVDTVSYLNYLKNAQRLELNTDYQGFDLVTVSTTNVEDYINDDTVMNIVSDNIDDYNNINFIQLSAVNQYNTMDGQLLIYYDTNDNSFHITTNEDAQLVLNGDVKVNQSSIEKELDEYSSVLTSADPITVFKTICSNIQYSLLNIEDSGDGSLVSLSIVVNETTDKYDLLKTKFSKIFDYLFVKVYANGLSYIFKLNDSTNTIVDNNLIYTIKLNQYITDYSQVDAVSLLYNTEIFISKL